MLSTEPTVVMVDTVSDAGIFIPNISFHVVLLHIINSKVAPGVTPDQMGVHIRMCAMLKVFRASLMALATTSLLRLTLRMSRREAGRM